MTRLFINLQKLVYKKNIFVIFGKFLLFFLSLSYYFSFLKFLIQ